MFIKYQEWIIFAAFLIILMMTPWKNNFDLDIFIAICDSTEKIVDIDKVITNFPRPTRPRIKGVHARVEIIHSARVVGDVALLPRLFRQFDSFLLQCADASARFYLNMCKG